MGKYINADEFIQEYNRIDLKPYINKGYAVNIDGYEMWKKWKIEFDQKVRQIVARLLTEREDEDKFIARIKDIPIMPMPSADVVEVKHGEWIDGNRQTWNGTYWFIYCSECLHERKDCNHDNDTPFCPNCGADMREKR